MGWYRLSSSKKKCSYLAPPKSAWQRAGATMSLNDTCAQYGVAEEQAATRVSVEKCLWGLLCSCQRAKPDREAEEAKVNSLKEELGEEGYQKHLGDKTAAKKEGSTSHASKNNNSIVRPIILQRNDSCEGMQN